MSNVAKVWSEKVGKKTSFRLQEVTSTDGRKQTHLINSETGGLVVAVNAVGKEAEKTLIDNAGAIFIDDAFTWVELKGEGNAVERDQTPDPTPGSVSLDEDKPVKKAAPKAAKKPAVKKAAKQTKRLRDKFGHFIKGKGKK